MRTYQAIAWGLGAFAVVSGCATVGREFDTTHVHDVQMGQDKAQISGWFGGPTQTTTFAANAKGCVERWQYTHAHAVVGAMSRITRREGRLRGSDRVRRGADKRSPPENLSKFV